MVSGELARLADYVRTTASTGRIVGRVGPFLVTITADDSNPYLNYAIPDDGAAPAGDDVERLVATFSQRDRVARLEYFPELCPGLDSSLSPAGFVTEAVLPLMGVRGDELRAPTPARRFTIRPPATFDELVAAVRVQRAAFGEIERADADLTAAVEHIKGNGGFVVAAFEPDAGRVVGAGSCSGVRAGFGKIAGIAVDESFRGLQLASALTASLCRTAFATGADLVFLTAGSDAAARSYARVGFSRLGDQVHTSLRRRPAAGPAVRP